MFIVWSNQRRRMESSKRQMATTRGQKVIDELNKAYEEDDSVQK